MKKNLLLLFLCTAIYAGVFSQTNQWTFYKGNTTMPQNPVFGTQGVTAATNKPGMKAGTASWKDAAGNLWVFGGNESGYTNDLWKYDPTTNNWTWMKGDSTFNVAGIYGTQGLPAATNKPGARTNTASWADGSGNLWMFGGYGYDVNGTAGTLNDLWKYNIATNEWTWIKGDNTAQTTGIYGTQGVADPNNKPGSRTGSTAWTDASGNFWLFSGIANIALFGEQVYNDVWKYDPTTNNWTWVKGNNFFTSIPVYGTQGVADPANLPGGRQDAAGWADASGNLWMFGGLGFGEGSGFNFSFLSDLWKYDISTNNWTWVRGDKTTLSSGIYNTQGVPNAANQPGARQNAASWTDASGNLWMMGGFGISSIPFDFGLQNDLWKYNTSTNEWTWVKGESTSNSPDRYGTLGVPDPNNSPGGRFESTSWTTAGTLWMFGGSLANDLWKYDIATNNWVWLKGDANGNNHATWGIQGVADAANKPSPKNAATSWQDASGDLWLFGGFGSSANTSGGMNDLWKYTISTGNWTWVKGDTTFNVHSVYGLQGVPDAANKPGARYNAATWTDAAGNLWLFGGGGSEPNVFGPWGELWKYDISTGNWTWIKGDTVYSTMGIYGSQGVANVANSPGARAGSVTWKDAAGNFWLFGGFGSGGPGDVGGKLNDLWKYDVTTNQWTWMKGDPLSNVPGVYGTKGVAAVTNKPGARESGTGWTDADGNLWLYGGQGNPSSDVFGYLNDLWKYNVATNQWTWIGGDDAVNTLAVYGTKGTSSPTNQPGGRQYATGFTDAAGNLWLFGGLSQIDNSTGGAFNDLWKYNITSNEWTWVNGDNIPYQPGIYGTPGIASPTNKPGARSGDVSWKDAAGNFWMYGGIGYMARNSNTLNDLWKYSLAEQAPSLSVDITNPANSSSYPANSNITINTTVTGTVTKVEFFKNGVKISEDLTSPYEAAINNIEAGNYTLVAKATSSTNATATDTVRITITACTGSGKISVEGYTNIPGVRVVNLTNHPSFPNNPSTFVLLNKFEYGNNIGNNYGARVRGYICAPQTGYYNFSISSDDQSELWLSTDDNPANKRKIAYLNFPVLPKIYTLFPSQVSAKIWLVKGARYYVETLHKEGVGLDHLSVAWKLPNGKTEAPIPGSRLTPYQTSSAITNGRFDGGTREVVVKTEEVDRLTVRATPNPSPNQFTLITRSNSDKVLTITITDVLGRVVERKTNIAANSTLQIGDKLRPGMYVVEVIQGEERQKLKLVRQ